MSHPVLFNNLVPLCYLSPYKNTGLFVRARIFNDTTNALLATKDLAHVEDGRYTDATFFMPDIEGLKVRYDVFTDAGYSIPSEDEGSIDERFYQPETPDALIRNDELELIFNDTVEGFLIEFGDSGFFDIEFGEVEQSMTLSVEDDAGIVAEFNDDTESFIAEYYDC